MHETEEVPVADKIIHLRCFVRDCDWWIAELDPHAGLVFGYVRLHADDVNAEWGYIDLTEPEAAQPTRTD